MHGCVKSLGPENDDEEEEEEEEGGEEEHGDRDEQTQEEDEAEEIVPLVPWAKSEAVSRDMLNIYKSTHQIVFAGGEGEDALAGVRRKMPTLVLVRNNKHASVMRQHVLSTIMLEHADSVSDGFFFKRCLVRTRSVGGESTAASQHSQGGASTAGNSTAEPPPKKLKSAAPTVADSSSEESSDSSGSGNE